VCTCTGEELAVCEELKHIPQGLDTALLETSGEKALALQTLGSVALITLKADGSVGNSYLTPGEYQTYAVSRAAS
jgi:hypothetical protein